MGAGRLASSGRSTGRVGVDDDVVVGAVEPYVCTSVHGGGAGAISWPDSERGLSLSLWLLLAQLAGPTAHLGASENHNTNSTNGNRAPAPSTKLS